MHTWICELRYSSYHYFNKDVKILHHGLFSHNCSSYFYFIIEQNYKGILLQCAQEAAKLVRVPLSVIFSVTRWISDSVICFVPCISLVALNCSLCITQIYPAVLCRSFFFFFNFFPCEILILFFSILIFFHYSFSFLPSFPLSQSLTSIVFIRDFHLVSYETFFCRSSQKTCWEQISVILPLPLCLCLKLLKCNWNGKQNSLVPLTVGCIYTFPVIIWLNFFNLEIDKKALNFRMFHGAVIVNNSYEVNLVNFPESTTLTARKLHKITKTRAHFYVLDKHQARINSKNSQIINEVRYRKEVTSYPKCSKVSTSESLCFYSVFVEDRVQSGNIITNIFNFITLLTSDY